MTQMHEEVHVKFRRGDRLCAGALTGAVVHAAGKLIEKRRLPEAMTGKEAGTTGHDRHCCSEDR